MLNKKISLVISLLSIFPISIESMVEKSKIDNYDVDFSDLIGDLDLSEEARKHNPEEVKSLSTPRADGHILTALQEEVKAQNAHAISVLKSKNKQNEFSQLSSNLAEIRKEAIAKENIETTRNKLQAELDTIKNIKDQVSTLTKELNNLKEKTSSLNQREQAQIQLPDLEKVQQNLQALQSKVQEHLKKLQEIEQNVSQEKIQQKIDDKCKTYLPTYLSANFQSLFHQSVKAIANPSNEQERAAAMVIAKLIDHKLTEKVQNKTFLDNSDVSQMLMAKSDKAYVNDEICKIDKKVAEIKGSLEKEYIDLKQSVETLSEKTKRELNTDISSIVKKLEHTLDIRDLDPLKKRIDELTQSVEEKARIIANIESNIAKKANNNDMEKEIKQIISCLTPNAMFDNLKHAISSLRGIIEVPNLGSNYNGLSENEMAKIKFARLARVTAKQVLEQFLEKIENKSEMNYEKVSEMLDNITLHLGYLDGIKNLNTIAMHIHKGIANKGVEREQLITHISGIKADASKCGEAKAILLRKCVHNFSEDQNTNLFEILWFIDYKINAIAEAKLFEIAQALSDVTYEITVLLTNKDLRINLNSLKDILNNAKAIVNDIKNDIEVLKSYNKSLVQESNQMSEILNNFIGSIDSLDFNSQNNCKANLESMHNLLYMLLNISAKFVPISTANIFNNEIFKNSESLEICNAFDIALEKHNDEVLERIKSLRHLNTTLLKLSNDNGIALCIRFIEIMRQHRQSFLFIESLESKIYKTIKFRLNYTVQWAAIMIVNLANVLENLDYNNHHLDNIKASFSGQIQILLEGVLGLPSDLTNLHYYNHYFKETIKASLSGQIQTLTEMLEDIHKLESSIKSGSNRDMLTYFANAKEFLLKGKDIITRINHNLCNANYSYEVDYSSIITLITQAINNGVVDNTYLKSEFQVLAEAFKL